MDKDLDLKFLAIGDSGVGKTCLLNQYVEKQFNENLPSTVGIDIRDKNLSYKSMRTNETFDVHLQLWDTAGQERFRSLTGAFFRDAIGFLLVFDLTNESSFLNVRYWISAIQTNTYSDNVNMILVGNKCDLGSERIISNTRAKEFAKQNRIDYIETSALNGSNIAQSIQQLLNSVMEQLEANQSLVQSKLHSVKISQEEVNQEYHPQRPSHVSYCCS